MGTSKEWRVRLPNCQELGRTSGCTHPASVRHLGLVGEGANLTLRSSGRPKGRRLTQKLEITK